MELKGKIRGCTNFFYEDIWTSNTATKYKINNKPSSKQLEIIIEMFQEIVQPLRSLIKSPLKVNSCYRSYALNKRIGGETYSDHMVLETEAAIDLDETETSIKNGFNNLAIAKALIASDIPFYKLILEISSYDIVNKKQGNPKWLHISFSQDRDKKNERIILGVSNNNPGKYIRITDTNKKLWGLK